jgi:hypothetical protein
MRNPETPRRRRGFKGRFKLSDLALPPHPCKGARRLYYGNPGRIIAPIFKPLQPVYQDASDISM